MSTGAAVRQTFLDQAGWCHRLGSPFTGLLCEVLGERLDDTTAIGRRVLGWVGDLGPAGDIVSLRLVGALHALVLKGAAPALALLYPPHRPPDADTLWAAVEPLLTEQVAVIQTFLDSAPQTNEVGRAGPLMVGLLTIAAETGLPLDLYEVGASAGLNLNLDRFSYDLDGVRLGDPASGVKIAPEWIGPPPPQAEVRVRSARGVDLAPLDVTRQSDRERLMAYVWADQTERLARLQAALAIAQAHPPRLDKGDAAAWVEGELSVKPENGAVRVLFHTVAFQYFPPDTQARIRDQTARIGAQATAAGPFAWLRYELDPELNNAMNLRLTLWPGGEDRVLGIGHPHGNRFKKL
jgi:hypothetical protein